MSEHGEFLRQEARWATQERRPATGQRFEEITDELERLEAIVDQLPKDANGAVVLWGARLWSRSSNGLIHEWAVRNIGPKGTVEIDNGCGSMFWRLSSELWGSREAAEAAGGE